MKICIMPFASSLLRKFSAKILFQEFVYGVLLVLSRCYFHHLVENSILYKKDIQHFYIEPIILFSENKFIRSVVGRKVDGQIWFSARSEGVRNKNFIWCQPARGEKRKNVFGAKWQLRKNLFGSQRVNNASLFLFLASQSSWSTLLVCNCNTSSGLCSRCTTQSSRQVSTTLQEHPEACETLLKYLKYSVNFFKFFDPSASVITDHSQLMKEIYSYFKSQGYFLLKWRHTIVVPLLRRAGEVHFIKPLYGLKSPFPSKSPRMDGQSLTYQLTSTSFTLSLISRSSIDTRMISFKANHCLESIFWYNISNRQ